MDRLAKRLMKIAKELVAADDDKSGFSLGEEQSELDDSSDYEKAKQNPIYGFLLHNEMTDDDWMYCSDSRQKVVDIGREVIRVIKAGDVECDENGEIISRPDGVELVNLDGWNLTYDSETQSYIADIDGKPRLVNVIGRYSERF